MAPINRRDFFRMGCCGMAVGYAASFSRFGVMNALAQAQTDYKALVCIFLGGGNDSNNMIVPMGVGYNDYSKVRSAATGHAQNVLLPIMDRGLPYGFHPQLTRIQQLYNQGKASAVLNVGPLLRPITKQQYRSGSSVPSNLYSHSDQQQAWQQAATSGPRSGCGPRYP